MNKKIKLILFFIVFIIGIFMIPTLGQASSNVKSILQIDTNLNNTVFDKTGIHIEGWKLADISNTKLKVYIDGKEVSSEYIKYSYKYDLISIVKGYGTYKENPTPMYSINIPTNNITNGTHILKIQIVSNSGKVLKNVENKITVQKIKYVYNIDTDLKNTIFSKSGIKISGWRLTTEANNKLAVYIDGKEVGSENIKYSYKYDLISIVKGYGTYKENPTPMFDINIPTTDLKDGKHNVKIQIKSENDEVLNSIENNITLKKVKYVYNIDTDLKNTVFNKSGIKISGWRLTTDTSNKITAFIDGKEVNSQYIKYSYKYDLISIVKGYGTYKENPTPMFDINIPTKDMTDGKHNVKIQFKSEDGTVLENVESTITVEKVKHVLTIDTKINNEKFDKYGIKVSGWKLVTEVNSKIKVYVDDKELSKDNIKYSYKYDLISIVKGYGTYKENPTPMFDINIPTKNMTNGKHTIKIQLVLEDGTLLESVTSTVTIDKTIKSVLNVDTNLKAVVFNEAKNIYISGWKLATEANTKLEVYIDDKKIEKNCIKYSYKYDLISIVKGYGTYEENPTPMFEIDIPTENLAKKNYKMKIRFMYGDTVLKNVEFTAIYGDRYKGIDASEKNGLVDWGSVATARIDFAMIRIGYRGYRGATLVLDKQALYNLKEAKANGIKVGVYFVTQAINLDEAREEALWVVSQLHQNGIKLDYPIAIDVEDSGARKQGNLPGRADLLDSDTRTMICKGFCDVIKYQGFVPTIYSSKSWFESKLNYSELSKYYDIWLAHYTDDENKLTDFSGKYHMWQYTSQGKINGIASEFVDIDICYKKY